jgi:8-oxo-dGTP diphosphatase
MKVGIDYTGISVNFICHDGQGNFVFAKRSKNCRDEQLTWETGGGRLKHCEDPLEGVIREVKEEYGVEISELKFLGHLNLLREHEGNPTHWITFSYLCKIEPENLKNNEPDSIDELSWFKLDDLPQPLHTGTGFVLKNFKDKLKSII